MASAISFRSAKTNRKLFFYFPSSSYSLCEQGKLNIWLYVPPHAYRIRTELNMILNLFMFVLVNKPCPIETDRLVFI